ncbi:MAG: hypothetical protein ACXWDL_06335 [Nocardioides sp.]
MFATRMRLAGAMVALAVAAPLVGATGAVADQTGQSTSQVAQVKKSRTVYLKGKEIRDTGRFIAYGRVEPGYAKRPAIIQRKLKSANKWSNWKSFKTDGNSKYRESIAALNKSGIVCYRIKVPGNESFKLAYSRDIEGKSFAQVCIKTSKF